MYAKVNENTNSQLSWKYHRAQQKINDPQVTKRAEQNNKAAFSLSNTLTYCMLSYLSSDDHAHGRGKPLSTG